MAAVLLQNVYAERAQTVAVAGRAGAVGAAFLALNTTQQDNALISEAERIDLLDYAGTQASAGQPMSFPRVGARSDALRRLATANIWEAITNAWKYDSGTTAADISASDVGTGNVKRTSDKTGPIENEIEYFAPAVVVAGSLDRFSDKAQDALQPLLASAAVEKPRTQWGQGKTVRDS